MNKKLLRGTVSHERLHHFECGACHKWWSIGDAPTSKDMWYCPWCGTQQQILPPNPTKLA